MKSKRIKNWKVNADHRPLAVIDAEKLNQKRQEEKKKKLFDCFCIGDLAFEVGKIAFIDGIKGTNMAFYPTEHLREFNDGVEAQNEARRNGIEPDPLFTKEDLQKAFEAGLTPESISEEESFEIFYSQLKKERK